MSALGGIEMGEAHAVDSELVLVPVHGDVQRVLPNAKRVLEGHAEQLPLEDSQPVLHYLLLPRQNRVQELDAVDVPVQIQLPDVVLLGPGVNRLTSSSTARCSSLQSTPLPLGSQT